MNERSERAGLPGRKIWSIAPDAHAPDGSFYARLGGGHLFHSAVLREALDIDAAAPCGLSLGTNRGQVFASADEGDSWHLIAELGSSVRVVRVRDA